MPPSETLKHYCNIVHTVHSVHSVIPSALSAGFVKIKYNYLKSHPSPIQLMDRNNNDVKCCIMAQLQIEFFFFKLN
jgi:hypothetical protein